MNAEKTMQDPPRSPPARRGDPLTQPRGGSKCPTWFAGDGSSPGIHFWVWDRKPELPGDLNRPPGHYSCYMDRAIYPVPSEFAAFAGGGVMNTPRVFVPQVTSRCSSAMLLPSRRPQPSFKNYLIGFKLITLDKKWFLVARQER